MNTPLEDLQQRWGLYDQQLKRALASKAKAETEFFRENSGDAFGLDESFSEEIQRLSQEVRCRLSPDSPPALEGCEMTLEQLAQELAELQVILKNLMKAAIEKESKNTEDFFGPRQSLSTRQGELSFLKQHFPDIVFEIKKVEDHGPFVVFKCDGEKMEPFKSLYKEGAINFLKKKKEGIYSIIVTKLVPGLFRTINLALKVV